MLRFGNLPAMMGASVHSGEDVILTATGPGSERVHGSMDNTEVFRVMADALGLAARSRQTAAGGQGGRAAATLCSTAGRQTSDGRPSRPDRNVV